MLSTAEYSRFYLGYNLVFVDGIKQLYLYMVLSIQRWAYN